MSIRFVIIITLVLILFYWYYQLNTDTNESYTVPYNCLNKTNNSFSLKSIKIKNGLFSKYRYTIGLNKKDYSDDEWKKKFNQFVKK